MFWAEEIFQPFIVQARKIFMQYTEKNSDVIGKEIHMLRQMETNIGFMPLLFDYIVQTHLHK